MQQRAFIGASLLVGIAVGLGATVFRADIAEATGLAQSVTVNNTPAQAVPVREQNLDGGANIKVHEQGTANIRLTKAPRVESFQDDIAAGVGASRLIDPITASQVILTTRGGELIVGLLRDGDPIIELYSEALGGQGFHDIPLVEPIDIDGYFYFCRNSSDVLCTYRLTLIGRQKR